jgi:hypothetical protein
VAWIVNWKEFFWQYRWYVFAPLILYLLFIQYYLSDMGGESLEFIYERF